LGFIASGLAGAVYHGTALNGPATLGGPCPATDQYRYNEAVADAQHIDVLCYSNPGAGSAEYQLRGSADGGRSWTTDGPTHDLPSVLGGLSDNGSGTLLVGLFSGASDIYRIMDDGATFRQVFQAPDAGGIPWSDVGFTTTTQALAVLVGTARCTSAPTPAPRGRRSSSDLRSPRRRRVADRVSGSRRP
jgi:hypothetical protein